MKKSHVILFAGAVLLVIAISGSTISFKEITITLPWFGSSQPKALRPLVIDVFPDGRVEVDNKPLVAATDQHMQSLQIFLKERVETLGSNLPVVLRPDIDARQERIMEVLNACAAAGVKDLTFN